MLKYQFQGHDFIILESTIATDACIVILQTYTVVLGKKIVKHASHFRCLTLDSVSFEVGTQLPGYPSLKAHKINNILSIFQVLLQMFLLNCNFIVGYLLAVKMRIMACRQLQRCVISLHRLICCRLRLNQRICGRNNMSGGWKMTRTLMFPTFLDIQKRKSWNLLLGLPIKLAKHYTQEFMSQEWYELFVDLHQPSLFAVKIQSRHTSSNSYLYWI